MQNFYSNNSNVYYEVLPILESSGEISNNNVFLPKLNENNEITTLYKDSVTIDGVEVFATIQNDIYSTRVDFYNYFVYKYDFEPNFIFGSNSAGQDLFSRLAKGTLFSLCLGLIVSTINFLIGLIYGSIEGFYGGKVDLIMERISDILSAIPLTIILVVCNIYFSSKPNLSSSLAIILGLFVAYIFTGWIGVASRTRVQFYRYKNEEYVLASKSLGARDSRLIFKHILPNALGTLITSSVLMIPGVIFSESSLSYLGIIDFSTSGLSSIGQLLNEGSSKLGTSSSYLLLFPCIMISLLMICFNLLGNGLRDAFNTYEGDYR